MVLYTFSSFVESQKFKYFQVMGRTIRVRQSQRNTKSAYASRKRPRSNQTSVAPSTKRRQSVNTRQEVPSLRQDEDTLSNDGDQSINIIANSVAAQILPEVRDQVIEAVTSMRTPSGSGITLSNISSQAEIVPAQMFSINDSLGFHVSQQLKDKIFKGEYIELGLLLDKSNSEVNKHLTIDFEGQLVLKPKTVKPVTDINMWLDAFIIYTSIYTSVHPESTQGMLKYMYNVKLGASRCNGLGWRDYDQQYRLKKAQSPTSPWGLVDQELWLLFMQRTPMYNNPQSPQAKGSNIQGRKCYEYNNRGRCTHPYCRYSHSCLKCDGRHPAANCRVPNTRFGQSNPVYNAINRKRDQNSIKRAGQGANKQLSRQ